MVSIPIEWRLGIKGSDEVKSELDQLTVAFNKAKNSGGEYGKEQRALSTAVNRRINEDRLQNRLLLAQHPMLLKASRAMSSLTSITRTLLTIQNTLNIARIASSNVDIEGLGIQSELNGALRRRVELQNQGKVGTEEWIKNEEQINILLAKQKEHIEEVKNTKFNDWITVVSTVLFGAASAFSIVKGHLKEIGGFLKLIIPFASSVGGSFMLIGTAMSIIGGFIADWLVGLLGIEEWRSNNGKMIERFFTQDIPLAIGQAGLALTQFFLTDLPLWGMAGLDLLKNLFITTWNAIVTGTNVAINGIISGIESLANSFIAVINRMVSAYNNFAKKVGLPKATLLGGVVLPRINIPLIPAAKGFDGMVNSPTMFLAGEAGPEQVSITPNGRSSGSNTVVINVAGSVITEKKLAYMVDQYQKQNLKSRGFTGFG